MACPICGGFLKRNSRGHKSQNQKDGSKILKCKDCGVKFILTDDGYKQISLNRDK